MSSPDLLSSSVHLFIVTAIVQWNKQRQQWRNSCNETSSVKYDCISRCRPAGQTGVAVRIRAFFVCHVEKLMIVYLLDRTLYDTFYCWYTLSLLALCSCYSFIRLIYVNISCGCVCACMRMKDVLDLLLLRFRQCGRVYMQIYQNIMIWMDHKTMVLLRKTRIGRVTF